MSEKLTQAELFADARGTRTYRLYEQEAVGLEHHKAVEARSRALGNSMLSLAEIEPPRKSAMHTMMANVDSFARSQARLNALRDAPFEEKEPYLNDVINFNHSLKTAIDLNPSYGFNEMAMTIANVRGASYGRDEARRFYADDIVPLLDGMRYEIGATQSIDMTGEFEVDYDTPITVRDEHHGVDIWVRRVGDPVPFGVDIKASEESARRAQAKSRHPASIIHPTFTRGDFGDSLRIPERAAQRAALDMRRDLRRAYASSRKHARA